MKLPILTTCVAALLMGSVTANAAVVYTSGHADIGVGFEDGGLHIHFHAEDEIGTFGGGSLPAGEYDADALVIGVPGPSVERPAGSQWDFLAAAENDSIWFLPAQDNPNIPKPFLGIATEELDAGDGWTTPLTWSFDSITTVSGDSSSLAIYNVDQFQNLDIKASSRIPTADGNDWEQGAGGHDHFNFGFTGEGLYEVTLSITGVNAGGNGIAAGEYSDTATFRFATGSAIAAVPEPSSALLLGLASAVCCLRRRR
ncbi:MAG: hypothetical protein Aurels2KO_37870 [Aureliella sp.]